MNVRTGLFVESIKDSKKYFVGGRRKGVFTIISKMAQIESQSLDRSRDGTRSCR